MTLRTTTKPGMSGSITINLTVQIGFAGKRREKGWNCVYVVRTYTRQSYTMSAMILQH